MMDIQQNKQFQELLKNAVTKLSRYSDEELKDKYNYFFPEFKQGRYELNLNLCAYGGCPIQFIYFESKSVALFASALLEEMGVEYDHSTASGNCADIHTCSGNEK